MSEADEVSFVGVMLAAVGCTLMSIFGALVLTLWTVYWVVTQYGWVYLGGGLLALGIALVVTVIYIENH